MYKPCKMTYPNHVIADQEGADAFGRQEPMELVQYKGNPSLR